MHASSVDLSVLLAGSPGVPKPPTGPLFVPTPNHDHVVDNSRVNTTPIWWEVRPILIMDRNDWPAPDGSTGITSSRKMDDAEAAGKAVEVGSNFLLALASVRSLHKRRSSPLCCNLHARRRGQARFRGAASSRGPVSANARSRDLLCNDAEIKLSPE